MNDSKSLSLDGFSNGFIKLVWFIVGDEFFEVVMEFFELNKIFK